MKRTWTFGMALLAVAALGVVVGSAVLEARAQGNAGVVQWEYAWVVLPADGPPVFSRAEREVTIGPSSEVLSGAVESIQQGMRRYRLQVRAVRDDSAAALDIAGQDGWEAVAVTPYSEGLKVLLKRRV